jgi:hypothetical protein
MKTLTRHMLLVAGLVAAVALPASAAMTPLNDPGTNAGTFVNTTVGPMLQSITLNGVSYDVSELAQIEMTAYKGSTKYGMVIPDTGIDNEDPYVPDPTTATRRALLEEDWLGSTGVLNPANEAGAFAANFKTPAVNVPGPDMFIYDLGNGDPAWITINGVEQAIAKGDFGNSGEMSGVVDLLDFVNLEVEGLPGVARPAETLDELLNEEMKISSTSNQNQTIYGVGIDFSDFDVAAGETVSGYSLRAEGLDQVIVGAVVPEPASMALLAVGGIGLALRRRRH